MNLTSKLLTGVLLCIISIVIITGLVTKSVLQKQGIDLVHDQMKAMTIQAESVRDSVSVLSKRKTYDFERLIKELDEKDDYRDTAIYRTVPIVAAWKSIESVAQENGMNFRVPKVQPRNPENEPTPQELSILNELKATDAEDYFEADLANNELIYARPIRLDNGCLTCHGDPAKSPTGDGLDILGFPMEDWKEGEIHGAFVLRSNMKHVDQAVSASFFKLFLWIIPSTLLIGILAYLLIRAKVVQPILATISEVLASSQTTLTASKEVSSASINLAEGASRQASSLEETGATLEEIESVTRKNASYAEDAVRIAAKANQSAQEGSQDMDHMLQAMSGIKQSSTEISEIIKTIDEIAFQTNILALNAAVEAARAGEAGSGFAVVADEVRSLAQRSAEAAKITAEKIDTSVKRSEDGYRMTEDVSQSLGSISSQISELNTIIQSFKSSSSEQFQGITQINASVSEIDLVTQQSAAGAEELSASANQTSGQAQTLQNSISNLYINISGKQIDQQMIPSTPPIPPKTIEPKKLIPKNRLQSEEPIFFE